MSIFNEVMASLYLYLMLCLTDYHGDDTLRDEIGWALLILAIFTVIVNLIKAIWVILKDIKEWHMKRKRKKAIA